MALNLLKKEISSARGKKVDLTEEVFEMMGPSNKVVAIICDALNLDVEPTEGSINGKTTYYYDSADAEEVRLALVKALKTK